MLQYFSLVMLLGIIAATSADDRERDGEMPDRFAKHMKPLMEGIAKAKGPVLYEGLPHQHRERGLLEKELKSKKTLRLHEFPFYEGTIQPKLDDGKVLTTLCTDRKLMGRYRGMKLCGGFHPDWCVEWTIEKAVYQVHICFGCEEARVYGPENDAYCNLDKKAVKSLKDLLAPYRKNRPASVLGE